MKRFIIIACLGIILMLNSCTKSCTCVAPDNSVSEVDVTMMEDCGAQSNDVLGDCY